MSQAELIEVLLDTQVRPYIQAHGGDVRIVDIRDGVVEVEFVAACACCELRPVTFAARVRQTLRKIDGVNEVLCSAVPYRPAKLDAIAGFFK